MRLEETAAKGDLDSAQRAFVQLRHELTELSAVLSSHISSDTESVSPMITSGCAT
jgi:uncharacterized protein YecT (DUF1311 family)